MSEIRQVLHLRRGHQLQFCLLSLFYLPRFEPCRLRIQRSNIGTDIIIPQVPEHRSSPTGWPSTHRFRQRTSDQWRPHLFFINGVWVEKSVNLKPAFKDIVNSVYKAEAEAVDFVNKPLEVTENVNTWVEEETNGLIKNLLPIHSIVGDTRIVLANALYFKGEWKKHFDKSKTETMASKYSRLPYKQGDDNSRCFSMYIFLPDERDGLHDLIEKVASDPEFIDRYLPVRQIQVKDFRIPKFKISFGFEASKVLKELGLVLPFDKNETELTEMLTGPLEGGNPFVSGAYHKCFVEIDEAGTVAAAGTAILIQQQCLSFPIDFVADHPFMFVVRDDLSGAVLFMGHVINPSVVGN
uniref:Serpin domain-containing protein n=1 Tax=Nelumbo nucifera TaxID=4432 RepID=A0A822ZYS1_NELNU|nr:TPA_asm: hypothetical protein HUJ06_018206 [Nelumbo nucifera]